MGHVKSPDITYGPIFVEGIMAAPRRCPYCAQLGKFIQLEQNQSYNDHIDNHIYQELEKGVALQCPHLACNRDTFGSREMRMHLSMVHGII
jgi:hypothetical protein